MALTRPTFFNRLQTRLTLRYAGLFALALILVAVAGLNALFFTLVEDKKLHAYAAEGKTPDLGMKISAFASLTIWVLVIVAGRLIVAFQGSSSLLGGSTDG